MSQLLFIGGLGSTEMILIIVVLLLMFGGKKLPELMRGAGRGIREFKNAMNSTTKEEIDEARNSETSKSTAEEKEAAK